MKKLLVVYDGGLFWTKKNASGIHVFEICEHLAASNDVLLFAPKSRDTFFRNHKFSVYYIPTKSSGFLGFLLYEMVLLIVLISYFIKTKPDVIYARSKIGIASLIVSVFFRVPRIVEVNGFAPDEVSQSKSSKLENLTITKILEPLNYKISSKIVAVTDTLKDSLESYYNIKGQKISVIENGANTELFRPLPRTMCSRELDLDDSYNYVCFVGNLAPWQGVEHLIKAAPLVLSQCPDTKFLIVGDGPMKNRLLNMVERSELGEQFIFTGHVPYINIPLYINLSEVCLALMDLSRKCSPMKVYEYLACGRPVIASRIPTLVFIEKEKAGVLIDPREPKILARKIVLFIKDKKLQQEMGDNGKNFVHKNHSWKEVAQKIKNLIEVTLKS